jgi:hypothetical protein
MFWRKQLRASGIEPLEIPTTDPLWSACFRRPRGALVRDVVADMRRERPGESFATTERILEICDRVAELAALGPFGVPVDPTSDVSERRARRKKKKHTETVDDD